MMQGMRKKAKGYMTVEAALIMSLVLLLYVFLLRSFFIIYDRCLLEQDMAALVMELIYEDADALEMTWQRQVEAWDREKYLWIEPQAPVLQKRGWKLEVTGRGVEEQWGDLKVQYVVWKINPTEWLRMKRRLEEVGD